MSNAAFQLPTPRPEPNTFTEMVAKSRWGAYMSAIEKEIILKGHSLSPRVGNAVEVGCEGGRWSKMLSDLGWKMTCVDIDAETLNLCQQRLPSARCILTKSSDTRIPCRDSCMDLLLCVEVPAVLPNSHWFQAEASRAETRRPIGGQLS